LSLSSVAAARPVVLLDPHPRQVAWIFAPEDLDRLHRLAEVVWARDEPVPSEVVAPVKDRLEAVIACRWRCGPVEDLPRLRAILDVAGGPLNRQSLDYAACFRRGIRVLSAAPAYGPPVAEMALGLAIAAARGLAESDRLIRAGHEQYGRAGNVRAFTLFGQRMGLIGYGGVARALRPLLAPFGGELWVHDPWLTPAYLAGQGLRPVDLDALLAECRVIFVLAIPSSENRYLLDRRRLELIAPDAVLVLVSRAHLVDFDALVELAAAGRFRAALDVFPAEPLPPDHPVRSAPNTVLTAHLAGHVYRHVQAIGCMIVNDLEAILAGLPPMEMQVVQPELVGRLR
jgi:phosphoglycerate dehydrogenase-like enzyme